ncbi:MAG: hypothetical protein WC750_06400 [Patescibacteria group bacterium]|jgi:hypothetical protein
MEALSPYSEPKMMSAEEARQRIATINSHLNNIRALILDFHDREGWRALGYESWVACVKVEFSVGQSRVYQLFEAAQIEQRISTIVENTASIPDSQLRPLAALPPEDQAVVYQLAKESAPEGKMTAKHVESTVREINGEKVYKLTKPKEQKPQQLEDIVITAISYIDLIKDNEPGSKEALAKIALHIWKRQHGES